MSALIAICSNNFFTIMSDGLDEDHPNVIKVSDKWAAGICGDSDVSDLIIGEIRKRPAYKTLSIEQVLFKLKNTLKKLSESKPPATIFVRGSNSNRVFCLNILSADNDFEPVTILSRDNEFDVKTATLSGIDTQPLIDEHILSQFPPTGIDHLATIMGAFIKAVAKQDSSVSSTTFKEFVFPW